MDWNWSWLWNAYQYQYTLGSCVFCIACPNNTTNLIKLIHMFFCFISSFAGPVTFPEPPTDTPVESSGVIIGGSGFGFVPPSPSTQQSKR